MRWRSDLQPVTTIAQTVASSQTVTQEARFAMRPGPASNGQVFVNVYRNTFGSGTLTFEIDTTSNIEASTIAPGSGALWATVTSPRTIAAGALGVLHFQSFTKLGDYVRWRVSTPAATGDVDFDVTVFFDDT